MIALTDKEDCISTTVTTSLVLLKSAGLDSRHPCSRDVSRAVRGRRLACNLLATGSPSHARGQATMTRRTPEAVEDDRVRPISLLRLSLLLTQTIREIPRGHDNSKP